jgi:Integrase core domain
VRTFLSYRAKRELLQQVAPRYREASSAHKTVILDEFVAATGYARKYAIRLLSQPISPSVTIQRHRAPRYGADVQHALHVAWMAANHICAKRLIPFLPTLIDSLERHGHLHLTASQRAQLLSLSPATADRLLQPYRQQEQRGISTTRTGTLLKKQIPIRTFQQWDEARPGFMEADLVAHCGTHADGAFLYTLTLTDIATGWTECLPLLNRGQETVIAALKRAQQLLPFPLRGIDTDNGAEFINHELVQFCEQEHITFTRGRARHSNDQCYVEQKNGQIVRQVVGYERFTGELAYRQMTELYRALRLYVNCFQPSMKLQAKQREGSKVYRRYERAQTPMQRVLTAAVLVPSQQQSLQEITDALDPVRLLEQLEHLQKALWRHAVHPSADACSAVPVQFVARQCADTSIPTDGISGTLPTLSRQQRRKPYHRSGRPHDWRTREDPFANDWEQVTAWLLENPELTGVELFQRLVQRTPGRYRPTQVRTLQRGLVKVRARLLVTFDDQWSEEIVQGSARSPVIHTEMVGL